MHKFFLIIFLLSAASLLAFAAQNTPDTTNRSSLTFSLPTPGVKKYATQIYDFDYDRLRRTAAAIKGTGIGITVLSGIPTTIFIAASAITYGGAAIYFSPLWVYGSQMTIAGILMIYLGAKQRQLALSYEDPAIYKYEMSKILRNAGIVILSTSVVPLAATVPYIFVGLGMFLFIAVNGFAALTQLALGIAFLAAGLWFKDKWEEIAFPEMALTRSGSNDSDYKLSFGFKIRI